MHHATTSTAVAIAAAAAAALTANTANAQTLTTETFATGLVNPLFLTHAPGDFQRVFIVEQRSAGFPTAPANIRIADRDTGNLFPSPFLTITTAAIGGEQGLLGLAFHPDYQNNGHFFIYYTAPGGTAGISRVDRYTVDPADPDTADPASRLPIIQFDQPDDNHNAGWIAFGPNDGYLYIASGDGGGAGDTDNNSQDTSDNLLGKMLRIDIDNDAFPADPARNYAIPAENPRADAATEDPEILYLGLRNPWRNAFDEQTGDLFIADVGQGAREEVNVVPADNINNPINFGWRCYEGNLPFNTSANCPPINDITFPVYEYSHFGPPCSITGGEVYRGCAIPELDGTYFFADLCSNQIWSFRYNPDTNAIADFQERTPQLSSAGSFITSFGTDAFGEMYIVSGTGTISRIIPTDTPADCTAPCPADTNNDSTVGPDDLFQVLANFGSNTTNGPADGDVDPFPNGDGQVGPDDLFLILANFGNTCD